MKDNLEIRVVRFADDCIRLQQIVHMPDGKLYARALDIDGEPDAMYKQLAACKRALRKPEMKPVGVWPAAVVEVVEIGLIEVVAKVLHRMYDGDLKKSHTLLKGLDAEDNPLSRLLRAKPTLLQTFELQPGETIKEALARREAKNERD